MFCGCLRRLRATIPHAVWVLCVPWILCERISHADAADLRRLCETLRLCVRKICPYVLLYKVNCTQNSQKYTEILLRMFCGCLRRLRETIPLRMIPCVPWILCERISHVDAADLRRLCETLRLCVKKICPYVLLSKKLRSSAKRVSQRIQREAFLPPYHTPKTNRRLIQFNMELN